MNNNSEKSSTAQSEEQVLSFWNENNIFQKSLEKESPQGDFVFYDGPPFATGLPHYGHLLPGTIKDIIPRYKTMRGYHVARKWGWDCHGLPIENLVEKELGLASKQEIEEYGIGKFNEAARNSVLRYEQDWKQYVPRSGRWVDMDNPYMSMQSSYMESVWWIFSQLHKKDLTKQGFKAMHLCPRCETTLANFEVNQGYKDVTDISVTAKFELVDQPETFVLAWTTTPWTLPGNVALAVGEEMEYVKVSYEGSQYILAQELLESVFEGKEYELVQEMKGSDLVGESYTPAFDYYQKEGLENSENGWKIYAADFVTAEDGTGIVHIAPAFGSDDMELGKQMNLPFVQHVARNGAFVDDFAQDSEGKSLKGLKVKVKGDWTTTDIEIVKWLAHNEKLFAKKKLVHSYPHCWRCDTPLLNYATSSWFVDVPSMKDRLVENNKRVNWVPDHVGEGRFGKWLDGARDWALSRSRFWGTPLPVWNNASGTETLVVGSVDELLQKVQHSENTYLGIRHGEAVSNTTGTINADPSTENGLTEKGKEQAQLEAKELKNRKVDYLFVSPLQRTRETADIIKQELGLSDDQVFVDERLRERNPGAQWEGKSWHDAHAIEEAQPITDFWNYRLDEDAESISDIYHRIMEFIFEMEEKYKGKTIVIVSHGGVLKTVQFAVKHYGDHLKARTFYWETSLPKNADVLEFDFKPFPHNSDYEIDLHRPYIDDVVLVSESGEEMKLLGDVFDVWFDSGSMPYAQVHYPFADKEDFEGDRFPAQFIAEGLDQTRGWFYVLSVLGTALFDKIPFENVVVNGLVLAEDGKKMSKSLKNYPDMNIMLDSVGADALRLFLVASPLVRGEEHPFSEKKVQEVSSKVMGRTRNVMTLYNTYKEDEEHQPSFDSVHVLDQWIAARTRQLFSEVEKNLESYQLDRAARPFFDYVDDFSTWYIRRSRDRFKSSDAEDKSRALATTRMALQTLAKAMAPFVPFVAEEIWQSLRRDDNTLEESVHLCSWPELELLEEDELTVLTMEKTRELVSTGLQLRSDAGVKVRQPLASLTAPLSEIPQEYHELVTDELNIKELLDGAEPRLDTEMTPELQAEGDVREFLRQVQSLRKKSGLEPHDMVNLKISTTNEGQELLQKFEGDIASTAGVSNLLFTENEGVEIRAGSFTFNVEIEK